MQGKRYISSEWRLLETLEASGAEQMAIDEAMLVARAQRRIPDTLRFFRWKPPAVTIGFFQSLEQEVDWQKARSLNIDVVRRYTGGGAVFHDREVTYSIVLDESEVSSDIMESYRKICGAIVSGLEAFGLKAEFRPINDVIVNGRKVSGNAQTRRDGVVLQHGTLLLDVDVRRMFSLLRVPDEKLRDKLISSAEERVTSLRRETGKEVSFEEAEKALLEGFRRLLGRDFFVSGLTDYERSLAERLCRQKYATRGWNFWR